MFSVAAESCRLLGARSKWIGRRKSGQTEREHAGSGAQSARSETRECDLQTGDLTSNEITV